MERRHYIEYRVYLQSNASVLDVREDAELLKDELITLIGDEYSPKVFTQDVTYEIVQEIAYKKEIS